MPASMKVRNSSPGGERKPPFSCLWLNGSGLSTPPAPRSRHYCSPIWGAEIWNCLVTLGEIQAGIELTRERDAAKEAEIEAWADLVAISYNVLPLDAPTFRL